MNYESTMSLVAGGLQFVVAGYALRLNRLFGTSRVGWSLFCAFALLALLHLIQSVTPSLEVAGQSGIKIEVMYALISLLLLTGMVHMEGLLKERLRMTKMEEGLRAELQEEVKKKTAYMMRAMEELQAEIDARKSMEAQVEESTSQLFSASRQVKAAESVNGLVEGMVNMLQSVNVSASLVADQVKQSKLANVVRIGNLISEHADNLGEFMSKDPRGQKLPQYISQLAEHLMNEQTSLTRELDTIKHSLEAIIALEQSHTTTIWEKTNGTHAAAVGTDPVASGFNAF
jgi:hypothetical protein